MEGSIQGFRLSPRQRYQWLAGFYGPGFMALGVVELEGALDLESLRRAVRQVVGQQDILRTTFQIRAGLKVPLQVVAEDGEFAWCELDLDGSSETWIDEALASCARLPWVPEASPPLRCMVVRRGPERCRLVLALPSLCADALSLDNLVQEIARAYRAICERAESEPEDIVQYVQVSEWQNDLLAAGDAELDKGRGFWRARAQGPEIGLPFERSGEGDGGREARSIDRRIEAVEWSRLRDASRAAEVPAASFLLACWCALLRRLTGRDGLAVGYTVDGRRYEELKGVVGPLAMALPLSLDLQEGQPFYSALKAAKAAVQEVVRWQEYVYAEDWWRGWEGNGAFGFEFQEQAPGWEAAGVVFSLLRRYVRSEPAKLKLCCEEGEGCLQLSLQYDTGRFGEADVRRLLDQFEALAASAARDLETPIGTLALLGEAQRRRVLVDFNRTAVAWPAGLVADRFAEQARQRPDGVAVVAEEHWLTFGELDARSNRLASRLRALGAGPERVVALALERSAEVVIGILGSWKAGAAYLPLDVEQPGERLASLLEESRAVAVLLREDRLESLPRGGAPAICMDGKGGMSGPSVAVAASARVLPETLAYVIYTSGSTGRPKGVAVTHGSLLNYVSGILDRLSLPAGASFATVSSFAADLGHTAVFAALCSGGSLHVVSEERVADAAAMADYMERQGIDCLKIVPSHLEALGGGEMARVLPVRRLVLGGEGSRREWVESLSAASGCQILNHYGPTEATVGVLTCDASEAFVAPLPSTVPLGRPLANSRIYVLDRGLAPLPPWASGELYIAGAGLARGYLGLPELTAAQFVPDPFSAEPGGRMYRTGDLARHRPEGLIEFLGRDDDQVKLRGYRIELGEVEAALRRHPRVGQAAVVARTEGSGEKRLVAYVVPKEGERCSTPELRSFLGGILPAYMVPGDFVTLRGLPLTRNGKLDRAALPAPERGAGEAGRESAFPRTPFEELLAGIWAEALRVERVGVEDNFFDLGGHSLLATRVISRIREGFGVTLPVRALFDRPTVSQLAESIAEALTAGEVSAAPPLEAVPREGPLPLSFAQQRLWFLDQLEPGSAVYNIPHAVVLTGVLEVPALARSVGEIVRRHEVLRTTFEQVKGEPVARIGPAQVPALPVVDLRELGSRAPEEARRLARQEASRPFDLERGPLLRLLMARLDEASSALVSTMHHIASDAWSTGILIRELSVLYGAYLAGEASPLPELPIQYADYALWQRRWLSGEVLASQLAYWKEQLAGAPPVLDLPTDRPRRPLRRGRGAKEPFALSAESLGSLRALVREEGATLFMGLLTVFAILLERYTGQEDLTVGTPIAGRTRVETEGLIGFFVNTLVLRAELSGNPSFGEQLKRIREVSLGAYAHQDLPFEQLVEQLEPVRDLSRTPLFQAMFMLQNVPREVLEIEGLRLANLELEGHTAKFDLALSATEGGAGLGGVIEYDSDLFDRSTVCRLAVHLRALLSGALAAPHATLSELPLQSAAELHQMLAEWNDSVAGPEGEPCVHHWIERQAARSPEAVAVVCEGSALSYGELDGRANRLGRRLRRLGVGPEAVVGICVERSVELVVGLLGILKAGGAYLPLDPSYPPERLTYLAENGLQGSAGPVLLVERRLAPVFGRWSAEAGAREVELDGVWELSGESGEAFESGVSPENLAYVIYTSGSTGRPKGVQVRHGCLASFLSAMLGATGIAGSDILLAAATLSFDLVGLELYLPLVCGGRVVVAPREVARDDRRLLELLTDSGVTVAAGTPPTWRLLFAAGWRPRTGFKALYGGEAMPEDLAGQLPAHVDRVWNCYGPTETTIVSILQEVREGERIGIGRPLANTQVYLLSRQLAPASLGSLGELCIGGAGVARGYADDPELTAERFVPDSFSGRPGARLYRTGDLGRFRPEGRLDFMGRLDFQVKVRGFRIELGEIESVLLEYPAVREVVVLAREDRPGDRRLAAYLVPSGSRASNEELRGFLRERLPEYMVPSTFSWLEALPLTASGKINRSALPVPEDSSAGRALELAAPRTPFEELLAGIWAEALRVERVGVDDNFFDLGGHSLLAIRVLSRIREAFGVTLAVRTLFDRPTVEELGAEIVSALEDEAALAAAPPLLAVPREGPLPLSFAQQRLWFLDQLEPGSAVYNIPHALVLTGVLEVPALARSAGEIVRRHEVLRTTFGLVAGEPVARIGPAQAPALPVVDLRELGSHALKEARRLARQEASRPFDLERGPLLRLLVARLDEASSALVSTMHHIASDGWSTGILIRELSVLYGAYLAGEASPLPELPIQYTDYALWQRRWLSGEVLASQLAYWKEQLAGAPPVLDLPTDRPRPSVRRGRGAREPFLLPAETLAKLKALVREEGATLFMGLLTVFAILLERYTGQEDLTVGTPVAGRTRVETEGLIGFFVNTLVLRAELPGNPSFVEQLKRIREVSLGAYAHQDLPFEQLVEQLEPVRDLSRTPLFQVMFGLQNTPREVLEIEGLRLANLELENDTAKSDLTLSAMEGGAGLGGAIEYDSDLFDRATVCRLAGHLRALLSGALAVPHAALSELPLQSAAELHQVLAEWNDTAAGPEGGPCVHHWIERQAARSPEAVAVVCEGSALSYGELDGRANRLGRRLRRLGVGPETVVGLCVERSVELVVGLLGILKAGGAYLPLDPSYPPERLAYLVENGLQGPARPVLLVERRLAPVFGPWSAEVGAREVELDGVWELSGESGEAFESGVSPENLAYVIYTSGSTGRPKGVQVRHGGLANFLSSMLGRTGIVGSDILLATTTLSFDVAGLELYLPLIRGARVVVAPREAARDDRRLLELLTDFGVTMAVATPATWRLLLEAGWRPRTGFKAICGGEAMPEDLAGRLLAQADRVWNGYGPTETTIGSILQELQEGERIGIGRPLANTQVYLLSRQLAPASLGSLGELCIGGAGVARGYADDPGLTAERFVPDPFSGRPGARLYRTGDLGRFRPEGRLDFMGRLDFQVKVRGFRIELGEIESVLLEHPAVREVVVLAREDRPGDRRLAAYLVPSGSRASHQELRGFLRERLPEYMVPSTFSWLEALPLTANGKVDRSALPVPEDSSAGRDSEIAAPRTPFEELLAGIWAEALQVERVGVDDNFFDLGGHSLLAIRVLSRIREAFGVTLAVRTLFDRPTVEQLGAEIVSALEDEAVLAAAPPLLAVPREGPLPLSFAQRRLWFVEQLEPGTATYNLPLAVRIEGALAPRLLKRALSQIVERHEVLRTTFIAVDGEPFQVVAPAVAVHLPLIDLAGLGEPHRQAEAAERVAREAAVPFDLVRGPLLRVRLLRLADGDQLLLLTTHHVVADGESMALLIDEVARFYLALSRGERPSARELPLQYADYASWQRGWLQGEVLERELAYWRRQHAGERSPLQLPMDHRPPVKRTHRGKRHPFELPSSVSAAIRALCAQEAATSFMFALAALSLLLARYAREEEVVVGVDLSSRPHRETLGLIGFFINMLVLRTDLSGDPSFRELLRRVRETSLEALTHQEMPYERLVEELRPERMSGATPLFQVVLNFTSAKPQQAAELLESAGLRLSAVEREEQTVRFDLMLRLNEADGRLGGSWVYSTELFEPTTILHLHERFVALVGKVVERPEATLSEIETEVAAQEPAEQEEPWLQAAWQQVRAAQPTKIRLQAEPNRG